MLTQLEFARLPYLLPLRQVRAALEDLHERYVNSFRVEGRLRAVQIEPGVGQWWYLKADVAALSARYTVDWTPLWRLPPVVTRGQVQAATGFTRRVVKQAERRGVLPRAAAGHTGYPRATLWHLAGCPAPNSKVSYHVKLTNPAAE